MRYLTDEQIGPESEKIFKEIGKMSENGDDLSMKCLLEWFIMRERELSAEQTIRCFRTMERNHTEELVKMKYGSFSHFGEQGKRVPPPSFKYVKYVPQPNPDI